MLQALLLIRLGFISKKMRSNCGKYVMDVAIYLRLGTIVIGIVKKVYKWPNWSPYVYIILAKGQLDHSYAFWTMPIMIFSLLSNSSHHPLCKKKFQILFVYYIRRLKGKTELFFLDSVYICICPWKSSLQYKVLRTYIKWLFNRTMN
jgi:hypothetical protein